MASVVEVVESSLEIMGCKWRCKCWKCIVISGNREGSLWTYILFTIFHDLSRFLRRKLSQIRKYPFLRQGAVLTFSLNNDIILVLFELTLRVMEYYC
jgi:hypothetical protein